MNRASAKLMSFTGILGCLSALVLLIINLSGRSDLPMFFPFFLLVAGILVIAFSLAYYTEK